MDSKKSGEQLYVETLGKIILTENELSVHAVTATALAGANARRLACHVHSCVFVKDNVHDAIKFHLMSNFYKKTIVLYVMPYVFDDRQKVH